MKHHMGSKIKIALTCVKIQKKKFPLLPAQRNTSASCLQKVDNPLKFLACSVILMYTSACFTLELNLNRLAFSESLPPKIDKTLTRDVIVVGTVGGIGRHAFLSMFRLLPSQNCYL